MMRSALIIAVLVGASAALAQITQPPEPVDPSPINGETYYLINQSSGLQLDLGGGAKAGKQSRHPNGAQLHEPEFQRWAMTKAPDGNLEDQ